MTFEVTDSVNGTVVHMTNTFGEATVSLFGANVLHWKPCNAKNPVFWSSNTPVQRNEATRGGVPVCWPWFAAHPTDWKKPFHGFARISLWTLVEKVNLEDGSSRIVLQLSSSEETLLLWPHEFTLTLSVTLGSSLSIFLTTTNDNLSQPLHYTEALHTYFLVGDIHSVSVLGLDQSFFFNKVTQSNSLQQGPLGFEKETDNIYHTTEDSEILDTSHNRSIKISKGGSRSTVVWNPWQELGRKIPNIGDDWTHFVCVETANAVPPSPHIFSPVTVLPGNSHTTTVTYSVNEKEASST